MNTVRLAFLCLAALLCGAQVAASSAAGDQTADGKAVYLARCASCHGATRGGGFGPALAGEAFIAKWSRQQEPGLEDYIRQSMPPAAIGSLSNAEYRAVTAYLTAGTQRAGNDHTQKWASEPIAGLISLPVAERRDSDHTDPFYRAALARREKTAARLTPVTDAVLRNPASADWPAWRRTLDQHGFSPLDQINRQTVHKLQLDWSMSLPAGSNGIPPLVHDGVMFLNASGRVMALDATSGELIWEHVRTAKLNHAINSQPRGIALWGSNVYVPTLDGHMLALDARTGKQVWDHKIFEPEDFMMLTSAPLVIKGKVIQGTAACWANAYKGGCFIVALDALTGKELWRFHTIARPGQPGGDSWNGAPVEERFGASVWTPPSYDPDLDLLYVGVGQTYKIATLLQPNARRGESNDALFTDSTLALSPDTGKLVWHYQHFPGDVWDLDWAFEQTLATLQTPKGPRRVVITAGKPAVFDMIDARTGQYISSADMGVQDIISAIDPKTGRKQINPAARFSLERGGSICPAVNGGRDWPSSAYDPAQGLLFLPMMEMCMDMSLPDGFGNDIAFWQLKAPPGSDGKFGRVSALDLKTGKIQWVNRRRAAQSSAVLATAGGLLFEGSRDRTLRALNSTTGETLWETKLSDIPNAFPISYAVNGDQYVAIVLGAGTPFDIIYQRFTPEIPIGTGARSLWVFKLRKEN